MVAGAVDVQILTPRAFNSNYFDGVDDFIDIPHNEKQLGVNLSSGFTISFWGNCRGLGENSNGRIIDKSTGTLGEDGFYVRMGNATPTSFVFVINNGTVRATGNITKNTGWYHILFTITSAAVVSAYVNGTASGVPGATGAITGITTTNVLRIGNRSTATDRTFSGHIAHIKMWNRVLTSSEILRVYAGEDITNDMIHYFKLGGDYTDYGSVGAIATNSGSVEEIKEDVVGLATKALRVTANDKWYLSSTANGKQVILTHIEEA